MYTGAPLATFSRRTTPPNPTNRSTASLAFMSEVPSPTSSRRPKRPPASARTTCALPWLTVSGPPSWFR